MEMTTPVYSTAGQSAAPGRMQFVMEERYGRDASMLPTPNNARRVFCTCEPSNLRCRMQFVMEERRGRDTSMLPTPNSARCIPLNRECLRSHDPGLSQASLHSSPKSLCYPTA